VEQLIKSWNMVVLDRLETVRPDFGALMTTWRDVVRSIAAGPLCVGTRP
jgi:hypothetical protein